MIGFWPMATIILVLTAAISVIMERRRNNREDADKVGFMPWNLILVMSLVIAAFSAGLSFRGI